LIYNMFQFQYIVQLSIVISKEYLTTTTFFLKVKILVFNLQSVNRVPS